MTADNPIHAKFYAFALRIVKLLWCSQMARC